MTDQLERFNALPAKAREGILDKHRNWNVDDDWWDFVYDQFVEKMTGLGFEVGTYPVQVHNKNLIEKPAIFFSGFGSQGDGACFNGEVSDWQVVFARLAPSLWEHWDKIDTCTVIWKSRVNHYYHSNTLRFDEDFYVQNDMEPDSLRWAAMEQLRHELNATWKTFTEDLANEVRGHCDQLYRDLESEYDHLTSDEVILESLIANDQLQQEIDEYEQASV